jgi:four helix bundle protein
MTTIERFEDIVAWQKGREFTQLVYGASRRSEFSKDFALRDQIRRAAISITSNIAEGFERDGNKEFINFLSTAKASCGEARSQLYVAVDEHYISELEFKTLYDRSVEISRIIDGFATYLKKTNIKGRKFQDRGD